MVTIRRKAKELEDAPDPEAVEPPSEQDGPKFPIVGIGASAGGLGAFEAFFSGMPAGADPGMAFVLVQHLAPDHKSILTDLIRRYTRMQVFEVEDGMAVQPNCAYIIPPNRDMAFLNGTLQLLEPSAPRGQRLPIDFFFRSLAQDQHERAICIVLSGTGSDGTLGVRAIKGEGGMIMVQDPASTEYDGMPRSAIATGLVDYELPPAEMPAQLIAYVAHAFSKPLRPATAPAPKAESAMKKIFILLRAQTGHDFSQYKPSTIHRRIERRMALQQIESIDAYVRYLQQTTAEAEALFRDLLIGVTHFFRDPEAFQALEEQVIPKLVAGNPEGAAVRVWAPGCSTGEEPYSIAILLAERQQAMKRSFKVQVFATDIDSQAIAAARAGLYPASIAADISPHRLAQFFTAEPDGSAYRIHKGIRDMLVFSEQDVIKDPPFSKIDLISCRNLLIYLGGDLQKKLIPLFHYALNPGGFLFLGTSETVGEFGDLFAALDRKLKLYQRKEDIHSARRATLGRFLPSMMAMAVPRTAGKMAGAGKPPLRELTEQALLQQIAPAGALISGQGDILYLHGRTGLYLEPAPGEAGVNNILKMAREGLRRDLITALHKAAGTKEMVRCPGLRVKTNGGFTTLNLTIRPVATGLAAASEAPLYLVILEDAPPCEPERAEPVASPPIAEADGPVSDAAARVAALKRELRAKEEYLQTANEELETSNEELKTSNEEMQSINEEWQSTNEELETSKEELQSLNEELATVNAELQTKVADLSRANNDMHNLLAGTGIGTVFVDHQLRILRFTPATTRIINLILSDVGRPVNHILSNLTGYDRLPEDVRTVLDSLIPKEVEVQTQAGEWYSMRILPYRTLDHVIEGAVITFVDISAAKRAQEALRETQAILKAAMDNSPAGIAIADAPSGALRYVNEAALLIRGGDRQSVANGIGIDQYVAGWRPMASDGRPLNSDEVPLARAMMLGETCSREFLVQGTMDDERIVLANAAPIRDDHGKVTAGIVVFMDVTERKRAEEALRKANHMLHLAAVVRDSHDAITVQDMQGRILAWNSGAARMYGWSETEALAMNIRDLIAEPQREEALAVVRQLSRSEILEPYRTQRIARNGRIVEVMLTATALVDEAGEVYAIATTERKGKAKTHV
jgi:two-component system CheB/CheR fusion protein